MSAPQFIYVALTCLSLGIEISRHGQKRTGNHSFPISIVATALFAGLLYWGRFFTGIAA